MGLLDNLLNAVESGALAERLNKLADTVEMTSEQADKTLNLMADAPAQALQKAKQQKAILAPQDQGVENTAEADPIT